MQDGQTAGPKQLLVERIKNATNILVTVSHDPSVDELSAALALTLMLNKMDKHATAVFSGKVPPAIEFLNPEKTFEGTVDSLRDFIIALDKEKADRLRYKVEDNVVRIFITPYRTIISEKDLAFSQGDFNVELIVALGVEKREDLDAAITAHGRILHDAVVATINTNNRQSDLGAIDWTDAAAGSFSEMLMSLSEALQSGILDQQIATALLTGIVAATERFSNPKTTPKVMTMAAQLMAAGANQQLIATKLAEGNEIPSSDGSKGLKEGSSEKLKKSEKQSEAPAPKKGADGEMQIEHTPPTDEQQAVEKALELAETAEEVKAPASEPAAAETEGGEQALAENLASAQPAAPALSVEDLKNDLANAQAEMEEASETPIIKKGQPALGQSDWRTPQTPESSDDETPAEEPTFGGTLNATTEEAQEDKQREEHMHRNHTLLSHDEPSDIQSPLNSISPGARSYEPPTVDPFAEQPLKSEPASPLHYETLDTHGVTLQPLPEPAAPAPAAVPEPVAQPAPAPVSPDTTPDIQTTSLPTLNDLESQAAGGNSLDDARAAVDAALGALPYDPGREPLDAAGAMALPPLRDDAAATPAAPGIPALEPLPAAPIAESTPVIQPSDIQLPPPPPLPDFSTLPPLPGDPPADQFDAPATAPSPIAPTEPIAPAAPAPTIDPFAAPQPPIVPPLTPTTPPADDPGQFKLPGQ